MNEYNFGSQEVELPEHNEKSPGVSKAARVVEEIGGAPRKYFRPEMTAAALACLAAISSGCKQPDSTPSTPPTPQPVEKVVNQDKYMTPPPIPGVETKKAEKVLEAKEANPKTEGSKKSEAGKQEIFEHASSVVHHKYGEVAVKSVIYFEHLGLSRVDVTSKDGSGLFCLVKGDRYLGDIDGFEKDNPEEIKRLHEESGIDNSTLGNILNAYPEGGKITIVK